ncbi:Clavaminate synthase-like protein [Hypoxylon trugodes]|uniref:Clavaminate synthase-like protein n=1 Tax=Hypoxylon trugodes TaxID=326681 RepID=UPI0021908ACD|nr:Clavaminate synthase-like protein [Hypoxylon trugodes]KAI1390744.1 Clavaminate synthase-like protein [Hypoxylon trugodes]
MADTKYSNRAIPKISLRDFDSRIDTITAELVAAAETVGFFAVVDHGITESEITTQFKAAERFFALPDDVKATVPFSHRNTGWEKLAQVRPSTGAADQKESYQMQYGKAMEGIWLPEEALPGFRAQSLSFMHRAQAVSEKLMVCFARGLGFPDDYFVRAHDVSRPESQTVLRLLRYFAVEGPAGDDYYRAGAHADWGFLTLLFQQPGQGGLEICPGREAFTEFALGDSWTAVEPVEGEIVCNIGDLLMSWSDDRFKSTFHRVKTPTDPSSDCYGDRYSMAYFNQPDASCEIQGPLKKYPKVTGSEFTRAAMKRNYDALEARLKSMVGKAGATEDKVAVGGGGGNLVAAGAS